MSMIDINKFTQTPVDRLKNIKEGDKIELLTRKKDRKITIIKVDEQSCNVIEDGFNQKTFTNVESAKLSKLLKQLQLIEFPRSKIFFIRITPAVVDASSDNNLSLSEKAMDINVIIEDNRYMDKFFRKFSQYDEDVKNNIYNKLPDIIKNRPHKIKPACHLKRNSHTIYEYKVTVKNANFRAAYIQEENNITVFFISDTTIKRLFVGLLEKTSLVDSSQ